MVYTMDERQLLDLWTVASCLEHAREIPDPLARSEFLTQAQIHLTGFCPGFAAIAARSGRVHPAERAFDA